MEWFSGKLRDELLNLEVFHTLLEARVLIERRRHCNAAHLHSSPGYLPPTPETVLPWPSGCATLYPEVVVGLTEPVVP